MTVEELMQALATMDPAAIIYMPDWNEDYRAPVAVNGVRMTTDTDWDSHHKRMDGDPPEGFKNGIVLV